MSLEVILGVSGGLQALGLIFGGRAARAEQLAKAREDGDINAEVQAQKMIARLGVEEARVANLKKHFSKKLYNKCEHQLNFENLTYLKVKLACD